MKKLLIVFLMLSLLVSCFAACGDDAVEGGTTAGGSGDKTPGATTAAGGDPENTQPPVVTDEFGRPVLESSLPELDYGNESVTIMIRSANQHHFLGDENVEATMIEQALFNRNSIVQDTLNVHLDLKVIDQKGSDTGGYDTTIRSALAGAGEYDIVTSYAYYTPALAVSGCFTNLNEVQMLDMESLCWNTTFAESVAYDGALYFNVGDYSLDYLRQIVAIYFNKDITENRLGDPDLFYDMVNDGSWTIDNVYALIKDIHSNLNDNPNADLEDFFAFTVGAKSSPCEALVTGLGFNYTVSDGNGGYQLFDMTTGLSDAIDKLHTFLSSECCMPRNLWAWGDCRDSFKAQKSMLLVQTLDMAEQYAAVEFDYGFLPMFKLDETQTEYFTGMGDSFSLQCIMANCTDPERAGAVLQCLNEVSYRRLTPEYFDTLLKGRFADAPQDMEMLELLRRTVRLDFGRIYSVCLNRVTGGVWSNFCDPNADYTTWYSSNASTFRELLSTLLIDLKPQA